jgi:hypothetical protein
VDFVDGGESLKEFKRDSEFMVETLCKIYGKIYISHRGRAIRASDLTKCCSLCNWLQAPKNC